MFESFGLFNLNKDRQINCPTKCAVCTDDYEDATHILFDYPMVVNVWKTFDLWQVMEKKMRQNYTVETIIFSLLQVMSQV